MQNVKILTIGLFIFLSCKEPFEGPNGAKTQKNGNRLDAENPYRYFQAVARSGLRIRETPSLKSKKIELVPYRAVGEVLEIDKKLVTIDERKGYWAKVKFGKITGWIFTGYALLSSEQKPDEPEEFEPTKVFLAEKEVSFGDEDHFRFSRIRQIGDFEIVEGKSPEQRQAKVAGNIYFKQGENYFAYDTGGYEFVERMGFPLPNMFITGSVDCLACCATYEPASRAYLVTKKQVKVVNILLSNQKADCGDPEIDYEDARFEIINKWAPGNSVLYQYSRRPHCDYYDDNKLLIASQPEREAFTVLRFTPDDILVEDYPDSGVPEKYLSEWKSKTLKTIKFP